MSRLIKLLSLMSCAASLLVLSCKGGNPAGPATITVNEILGKWVRVTSTSMYDYTSSGTHATSTETDTDTTIEEILEIDSVNFTWNEDDTSSCYSAEYDPYTLFNNEVFGDVFAGTESDSDTTFVYSTSISFSGSMLVITSGETLSGAVRGMDSQTDYYMPYRSQFPPSSWPATPCLDKVENSKIRVRMIERRSPFVTAGTRSSRGTVHAS